MTAHADTVARIEADRSADQMIRCHFGLSPGPLRDALRDAGVTRGDLALALLHYRLEVRA